MKISLNTIAGMSSRYGCCDGIIAAGPTVLAEKVGAQLGAIEETENISRKYQGIIVVRVVHCRKHDNSDHLNICLIDDGGVATDVERDTEGLVQVVCGAPNVREGLLVAWLPPGSTVPESALKDPFVLGKRELRGVVSNGMLASPRELALGDSHDGILEIIDPFGRVQPGDDFAATFELKDDVLFDIENKMFTHRPDCFGFLGVARELAGIQGLPFRSPEWYRPDAAVPDLEAEPLALTVTNELPELVPRFTALAMRDVQVGPSPTWLVVELAKIGVRSINNIVDYTNYFMLETGQPLHAYDYDKVAALTDGAGAEITVRAPHSGEKISLLNGKTIEPRAEAIMIASGSHLIGVGGVMGGADTEVDSSTRNIIVEVATFDMYSIRRTSMAHGLFTDAVTRFNKGQSPLQNQAVMAKVVTEIRTYAGGKVASEYIDINQLHDREWVHPPVQVSVGFVNDRLGLNLSAEQMQTLLRNVEFQIETRGDVLIVTAPFWRTDIETREDVVEEVGRLYGFDKLPLELPQRSIAPASADRLLSVKAAVRQILSGAGANEVLTYSFVHGDLIKKVGQDSDEAFRVSNALSPDLQYYRLSLTPSLLDKVHLNIKAGYDSFALFEIGKVHGRSEIDEDGLPREMGRVTLVVAADAKAAERQFAGAPYYQARRLAEMLVGDKPGLRYVPLTEVDLHGHRLGGQMLLPFDTRRAAALYDGEHLLGVVGEYNRSVARALKLPDFCAGFELFLTPLGAAPVTYRPLPRYPKVTQDITLKVAASVPYQQLASTVQAAFDNHAPAGTYRLLLPLDIYQRSDDHDHKQVTFRCTIAHYERTLTDIEVVGLLDEIAADAAQAVGAEHI